jgi:hypothetical protein
MAVFTAIATSIVAAIGITGTLATIATAFVAAGLAIGTSKILGVMDAPKAGEDPGVKVQLPPATDNKVPRLYGQNFTGGTIIDAEIKNQNKTMTYCLVLSDMSDVFAETWTVNKIYRGDVSLNFSGATVVSTFDPNATASVAQGQKIRVRVYAGGSDSTYQIFPTTGKVNAYGGTATSKSGQFLNWTSANAMNKLVFAIVEIDYDAENDLVGLGAFTFDISTNLRTPTACLVDYLNSDRYGMGNVNFPVSVSGNVTTTYNIDSVSLNAWQSYTNTNNVFINGGLSTFNSIKSNLNKILMSGGAFLTYNNKIGQFAVVVNRAATSGELANAFVLSDDNLVGALGVTNTDLFNMYNQIEIEFPSVIQKDQTDTVFLETPSGQRNYNEPDNKLNVRFDLTNDRRTAINLANIDLRQGRYTTVVTAKGDFSTFPIDAGDVVKFNNDTFNWNEKLFRVMQTKEVETADSMLYNELTLLEYDADVYTWTSENPSANINLSGIPGYFNLNTLESPTIGNVYIFDSPGANANIFDEFGDPVAANVTLDQILVTANSTLGNTNPVIAIPFYVPSNTSYNVFEVAYVDVNQSSNSQSSVKIVDQIAPPQGSVFVPDRTYWYTSDVIGNFVNLNGGSDYSFDMRFRNTAETVPIISNSAFYPYSLPINTRETIVNKEMATYGAGTQLDTSGQVTTVEIPSGTDFVDVIDGVDYIVNGIEATTYRLLGSGTPSGDFGNITYALGFGAVANVTFANATSNVNVIFDDSGTNAGGLTGTPPLVMYDSNDIDLDPAVLSGYIPSLSADMRPVTAELIAQGFSTLGNTTTERGFFNVSLELTKITRSEVEP